MAADDQRCVVSPEELMGHVLTELYACPSRRQLPSLDGPRVGPQHGLEYLRYNGKAMTDTNVVDGCSALEGLHAG